MCSPPILVFIKCLLVRDTDITNSRKKSSKKEYSLELSQYHIKPLNFFSQHCTAVNGWCIALLWMQVTCPPHLCYLLHLGESFVVLISWLLIQDKWICHSTWIYLLSFSSSTHCSRKYILELSSVMGARIWRLWRNCPTFKPSDSKDFGAFSLP